VPGDFLQLPPVRTSEAEPYDWAFRSSAWEAAGFRSFVLDVVRRQDEPEFVQALGDFRVGRVWGPSARLLQSRVINFPPANMPRLCTHNVQVDKWNEFQLSELPGDETVLEAVQIGPEHQRQFLVKNLLTPATLRVKPGALVMFTVNKNEPDRREPLFVNGQTGIVESVQPGASSVLVRTNGAVIPVERFEWRYDAQDPGSAVFSQFPLRLAWAMTIHKAQGRWTALTSTSEPPGSRDRRMWLCRGCDRWPACSSRNGLRECMFRPRLSSFTALWRLRHRLNE